MASLHSNVVSVWEPYSLKLVSTFQGAVFSPGQPTRLLLEPCSSVAVGTLSDGPWDVALHNSFLAVSSLNLVKSVTPSLLVSCRVSRACVRAVRESCANRA